MIFKEESILFPASLEKLSANDWVDILSESDDVGYVFIQKPEETEVLIKNLQTALLEEPVFEDNTVSLPTGPLPLKELMYLLNTLPTDLTFVDKEDTVRYFSDSKDKIFRRTKAIIGRKVQNCHPPQSVDMVEKILTSFKEGKRDSHDFWIDLHGRSVYIKYFAVRDEDRNYLGTLEVTQDITEIKKLEGQKRLSDETGLL
jgi:PAS domain S-box-containing protein